MKKIWTTPAGYVWSDWQRATSGAHTLIAGTTGSGKSVLLNDLAFNLIAKAPSQVELYLIDPKRVELFKYRNLPHTKRYAQDINDIIITLKDVINDMDNRYKEMQRKGLTRWAGADKYILIDELADIMVTDKKAVLPLLQKIAQLGRACGVHLICATQAPNRRVIPAELTLNFTERICLKCISAIESRQVIAQAGAEELPQYGEALYSTTGGIIKRMLVPLTPESDLMNRINYWINTKPRIQLF